MNREQVLATIKDKSPEEIEHWLVNLEDEEFIEVTGILEQIAKELPVYHNNDEFRKEVDAVAENRVNFEDICNKEAVQKLKNEMELDESFKKLEKEFNGLRESLIQELLINPDQEGLINMIKQIIQIEKDHNTYNPDDWEAISYLM